MKSPRGTDECWERLARRETDRPAPARFDPATLGPLPAPAARWLRRVVPEGAELVDAAELAMTGEIKLGSKWLPFTAEQVLRAGVGFVWKPVVGGRLLRFVGADLLAPDGEARMEFRLHGIVPVAKSSGPDVARSAAGRLAAETLAWLPQAVTPQAGAQWRPIDDRSAAVTLNTVGTETEVAIAVADDGRLERIDLRRWNDSSEPPGLQPFGADIGSEYTTDDGVRVAGSGSVGWGHLTPAWPDGEFFRYSVTRIAWIADRPG